MSEANSRALFVAGALVVGLILGYIAAPGASRQMMFEWFDRDDMMPRSAMMHNGDHQEEAMESMTYNLKGKTGAAFDKAFLQEMIIHHQGAVEMANLVLQNAEHDELKTLAKDIITAQTKEIDQMKNWLAQWFK